MTSQESNDLLNHCLLVKISDDGIRTAGLSGLPEFSQSVCDPRVGLGGRREGRDLDVQIFLKMLVLRVRRIAQFLLLKIGTIICLSALSKH